MSGNDIKLNDKDARRALKSLEASGGDLSPAMDHIAQKLLNSVRKNFKEGGRYSRADSIIGGSTKWDPAKKPPSTGSTLFRFGDLYESITPESNSDTASLSTNLEKAALLNFGGEVTHNARSELFTRNRAGKGSLAAHPNLNPFSKGTAAGRGHTIGEHTKTMPARPFMVIQEQDIDDAKIILRNYVLRGVK